MRTAALFLSCILIWGSTWYAITFQLGAVPVQWSVTWRFLIAATVLFGYCAISGRSLRLRLRGHLTCAGLGAMFFSVNYAFVYWGTDYLPSGLVAVLFSMIAILNQVNGALFLGQRIEARVLFGALAGLGGLVLIFLPEIERLSLDSSAVTGILLVLTGTLIASFGNTVAASGSGRSLPLLVFNGYGMLYGALIMAVIALLMGQPPAIATDAPYLLSLLYLAVLGTVVTFTMYLTLLKTVGVGRAAYIPVAIPVVALAISTLFEGYSWTFAAGAGVLLVVGGNLLLIRRRPAASAQADD